MDVFEKVQQIRPEIEGAEENVSAAHALLLMEIQGARPRWARKPWFIAGGILGAAAAVTAGVLVVSAITAPAPIVEAVPPRTSGPSPTVAPSPVPTTTPTAKTGPEVLIGAANAAAEFRPPALAPGQYLRLSWTQEFLGVYDATLGYAGAPGYSGSRSTATSGWILQRSGADYAPAVLTDQWYQEEGALGAGSVFGNLAEGRAEQERSMQGSGSGQALHPSGPPRLPESGAEDVLWFFDSMPRDPDAMIAWIHDYLGPDKQGWADGKVGWLLIGLLSQNIGDPEMRASMYRALSLLPGSTVGAEQGGKRTVTFDADLTDTEPGQTALRRYTLTIDMATGMVTETTDTSEVGEGVVPSDVPDSRMTFDLRVVDTLPW